MRFLSSALTVLSLVITSHAWSSFIANEFASNDCSGPVVHAHVGLKYWQIIMSNQTNSVYVTTANDGIYRWFGFPHTADEGRTCDGDTVGRLYRGCYNLRQFEQKIECIQWCSTWVHNKYACSAIGQ
ncbi:hypothetical protein F4778DRAFT_379409 [Xylariomycetidae sp. FL2044]|nr:hypothetical protein F4778DRAFT_379409 [Xylariomycetidae sp. FL2044]